MFLVYSITIFVNAALLFLIQPMIAKMILPFLGGSPAVWNMSLFFFQALLLAGYLYAHLGSTWLGTKRHAIVHLTMVLFAVSFLPVFIPHQWFSVSVDQPAKLVLSVLFAAVGFPFFVLSAGSPLLQKWFASTAHPEARDPYFLYAASNLGSMVGLLAYPAVLEPYFSLAEQSRSWFYGYLALVAFMSTCVLVLWRSFFGPADEDLPNRTAETNGGESLRMNSSDLTFGRRMRWVVLALVPSSLLLGVTTYVTTDVASAQLFWIAWLRTSVCWPWCATTISPHRRSAKMASSHPVGLSWHAAKRFSRSSSPILAGSLSPAAPPVTCGPMTTPIYFELLTGNNETLKLSANCRYDRASTGRVVAKP